MRGARRQVLDRGEKIELLVDKTDHLQGDAFRFKKQTTRLKQQMWMKSVQMTVLIVCAGLLALYFLSWSGRAARAANTPA